MLAPRSHTRSRLCRIFAAALAVSSVSAPICADATAMPSAALLKPRVEGQLNVNTATAEQWALLPGIGPATAAKLVTYRERHPFRRLSHVMRVKGVGRKTYAAIRPFLTIEGETTLRTSGPSSIVAEPPVPW